MPKTSRLSLLAAASTFASALVTLAPSVAHAEGTLGEPNQVILSAERLFGLSFWSVKEDNNGATGTTSGTTLSILASPNGIASIIPYLTPRLAADFSLNAFTIGGSIGYWSTAYKTDPGDGTPTRESDTVTSFVFTPRVGYVLPIAERISFWPRAGITYFHVVTSDTGSFSGLGVNLEPSLVFSPAPHFGILLSALGDIPLSGTRKSQTTNNNMTTTNERDYTISNFGGAIGLLGYF